MLLLYHFIEDIKEYFDILLTLNKKYNTFKLCIIGYQNIFIMTKSITMSFSAPVKLSIKMEAEMELKQLTRSELIKIALNHYLESQQKKNDLAEQLNNINNNIAELRDMLSDKKKRFAYE